MIRTLLRLVPSPARPLLRTYTVLLAAVVVTRAATCVLLVPVLGRLLVDDAGGSGAWIAAFLVVAVTHLVLQHRLARTGFALGLEVLGATQHRLVDQLAALPAGWATGARRASTQASIATTGITVAQTIGNLVTPLVLALALPIGIGIGLLLVAWPLGLAALAASPLLVGSWWLADRASRRADAEFAASVADLDDRIIEFGRAQRTLRGARRADPDRSTAGAALESQHVATISLLRWSVPGQLLFSIASQLALLVLAITALALIRRGEVTVAEAIGLLVVAVRFLDPFTTLGELAPAIQATSTTLRGIEAILSASPLEAVGEPLAAPSGGPHEVRLEAVRFRYPGATDQTIDGVDLIAPAGATTAIVGPSGAGKSTLLALIARFHDVEEGRVLVGGEDVRSIAPTDLYRDLSFVFQNVYLFEGTIRDNVLLGNRQATAEQLAEAAALARVDEVVDRLPAGWDTPVGEGGVALSGGERQRVGIARALLKPASLLLVDEATSALDPMNERAIAAALAAGEGRRTTIVVAHRMQTIEQADHVVFVEAGKVVEAGPRTALLARGGRFAAFHRAQEATATWTVGR